MEWCICFLSISKQKSSLSIFNSNISLGKAFVYFSARKICQNGSLGNRKPCLIHRTSITGPASSLPMFHQYASTQSWQIIDFIFNTAQMFSLSLRIKYCNVFINLGLTQITTSHPNSNSVATGTSFAGDRARTLGKLCCRNLPKKSRGHWPSPAGPVAHTWQQHYLTKAVLYPSVPSFAMELITAGCCDVHEQLMKEFKFVEGC